MEVLVEEGDLDPSLEVFVKATALELGVAD
jgi:hypothetical protein